MALAHAITGATRPTQIVTWSDEDGVALNLTGATITGKIRDAAGTVRAIAGVLTVTDGTNGVFSWAYDAADVVTAGQYRVQFTAAYGSNPTPARTIVSEWLVKEAIS